MLSVATFLVDKGLLPVARANMLRGLFILDTFTPLRLPFPS